MPRPIPTSTRSTTISPVSTARKSATSPRPAAAICRSTRSISPICAMPSCASKSPISARTRPLCRGNFAGAWVADGGYEPIAELIFNEINMDGYFLEYDSARAGGFEPLRFLPRDKVAVLGLVTTKSAKLESKDELKRRIDEASKHAPLEQLALSPQCGFSSGIGGNTMDEEGELAKLRLVVETAREVWGSA